MTTNDSTSNARQNSPLRFTATELFCIASAIAVGCYAAYVDRHNATEVYPTLGVLLLGAFLIALIAPHRPWRWALIIAPWVPFCGSLSTLGNRLRSPGSWAILAIVLVPSLIGVFTGAALRRAAATRSAPHAR